MTEATVLISPHLLRQLTVALMVKYRSISQISIQASLYYRGKKAVKRYLIFILT